MSNPKFLLYYNTETDALGIAANDWEYLCVCKFVPVVRRGAHKVFEDGADPINFVAHEICEERSAAWVEVGEF